MTNYYGICKRAAERRHMNQNRPDFRAIEEHECRCCWDLMAYRESIAAGFCLNCRRKPEHTPTPVTARTGWAQP